MTALPNPPQATGTPVRRRFATAIEDYLACKIDNQELDEAYLETSSAQEEVCDRIGGAMWRCYSDWGHHRNEGDHRIPPEAEAMIRRWIVILRSDAEWEWLPPRSKLGWLELFALPFLIARDVIRPEPLFRDKFYWPFSDEAAWKDWRTRHPG